MHCMRMLNMILGRTNYVNANLHHARHCLGYLRVMALCHPDLTLEPGDFSQRNFTRDPFGATHECTDFGAVYDEMEVRFTKWMNS
jgi:hypothetical protein